MKYLKIFLVSVFFLFGIGAQAQNKTYRVEGTIQVPGVQKLYFTTGSFQGAPNEKAREVAVKDNKFSLSGNFAEPVPVYLSLTEEIKQGSEGTLQFILDAGKITVTVKDKLSTAQVTGSKANNDFKNFSSGQASFSEKFKKLNIDAQAEMQNGAPQEALQAKYGPLFKNVQKEMTGFQRSFILKNPSAYISLIIIPQLAELTQDYVQADSLYHSLNADLKTGKAGQAISSLIDQQKKTSIGATAPDFSLADTTGQKISLSSLKGKYVLLDFWASWCGPCRDENPNVVEAYQTFKDKGFTVFGVSLDRERKNWIKAIEADQLTWPHVSDLKFWSSEAAVLYGITAIPRNFLLDPQGKIIARDLRGPALIEKLEEVFKK